MTVYCDYCMHEFKPNKEDLEYITDDPSDDRFGYFMVSCPRCGRTLKVYNPLEQIVSERIRTWGY